MLRFRRFRTRLLVLVTALVVLAQGATFILVRSVNRSNATNDIDANLAQGAENFSQRVALRLDNLTAQSRLMAGDYALRQVLATPDDRATLQSALRSYTQRIGAPVLVLLDPSYQPLAGPPETLAPDDWAAFARLAETAEFDESPNPRATGYALVHGQLHALLVVPVFAPPPVIYAWVGVGFAIDDTFVSEIKASTRLEITFRHGDEILVSTVPTSIARRPLPRGAGLGDLQAEAIGGHTYLTRRQEVPLLDADSLQLDLQRSLDAELAPVRWLENLLLQGLIGGAAAAVLLAFGLARSVSAPVQELAGHTRRIAQGDYKTRLRWQRADELGQLATAFNAMSQGLAERDQVRDLLDKNVSPAVAAQLLREGSALGGEEREMTIMFADLRGFTPLSEGLAPTALVSLLNRYLDRMATAIEHEGGVIDKFIGDEVMALFGAPVSSPDHADRALRAALAMRAELAGLNRELAGENLPPLAFGIGLNTDTVVAGNIGSTRRLNYSVIGDGVNIAARLQSLTRVPELATDILVSARTQAAASPGQFTFRDCGAQRLKGRAAVVRCFALPSTQ